jgi:hypothetical protein
MAAEIVHWMEGFLVTATPMMKRSRESNGEPICPFAKPCLDHNALYLSFHHEVNGKCADHIASVMLECRKPFRCEPPYDLTEHHKKALLVIFPEIPVGEGAVLDVAHDLIKTQFVQDGLMVTQCYPRADGRSVHNTALRVYAAPHCFMAVRYMALHDILFVEENETWFGAYDQRFGIRFREPEKLDDHETPLLNVYRRAKARFVR